MAAKFSGKEASLETLNAVIWSCQILKQTGEFPTEDDIAKNFSSFTRGELLYYLFNLAQYPSLAYIKNNLDGVIANLTAKRDAISASESVDRVSSVIPEVTSSSAFAGKSAQDILNEVNAAVLILNRKPAAEEIEAVASIEKETPLFTFAEPEVETGKVSENLDPAADVLVDEGLVKETGEPDVSYTQRLLDENYKKLVEEKLSQAVAKQQLQSQFLKVVEEKFSQTPINPEAAPAEVDFIKRTVAEKVSQAATPAILTSPDTAKAAITSHLETEKGNLAKFVDTTLTPTPEFANSEKRQLTVNLIVATISAATSDFTPKTRVSVELNKDFPEVKVVRKTPEAKEVKYYYPNPLSSETFSEKTARVRKDAEVVLKTAFTAANVIPTISTQTPKGATEVLPAVAGGAEPIAHFEALVEGAKSGGRQAVLDLERFIADYERGDPSLQTVPSEKIEQGKAELVKDRLVELRLTPYSSWIQTRLKYPQTIWTYDVPPLAAASYAGYSLLTLNPIATFSLLPLAPAYFAYLKVYEAQVKLIQFKKQIEPYISPGPVLHQKLKETAVKLALALPWLAVRPLVLGKYQISVGGAYTGQYRDFRLTHGLRTLGAGITLGLANIFENRLANNSKLYKYGSQKSVLAKALRKGSENLKPFYNKKYGVVDKKRRSPWGIILGFVVVDVVFEAIKEIVQRTALKIVKNVNTLKSLGDRLQVAGRTTGSITGGVFSLNTVAGGALGFALTGGNPIGIAFGAFGGAGLQTYRNIASDTVLRARYLETKFGPFTVPGGPEVAEIQVLGPPSRLGRITAALSKPAWWFKESELRYIPLKGTALGFVFGGPIGALEVAGIEYGLHLFTSGWVADTLLLPLTYNILKNLPGFGVKGLEYTQWLKGVADERGFNRVQWTRNLIAGTRGGAIGVVIALPFFLFAGAPWWVIPAAFGTGWLTDFTWKAFKNRFFPASAVAKPGLFGRLGESALIKVGGKFLGWVGLVDIARTGLDEALKRSGVAPGTEGWKKLNWTQKIFVGGLWGAVWVLDRIFGFVYKVLGFVIGPVIGFLSGPLGGLVKGALGLAEHIPGIGGWFGTAKNWVFGVAKGAISAILGLFGAIFSLLTGGDIAEAAVVGAIGLALGGSLLNAHTIQDAFFRQKPAAEAQRPTPFASLSKNAETQNPHKGPSPTVSIGNNNLPQEITFQVKLVAQNNLSNLSCSDELVLIRSNGVIEPLPLPPIPPCPQSLNSGQEFSFSFQFTAPNEDRFKDSIVKNTFKLNGSADIAGVAYWIPMRDTSVRPFGGDATALENFKNFVRTNYPNNLIDVQNCFGYPTCWDFVVGQSLSAGVNPTFILAVWYEESHFSDTGNHLSCPSSITRPHTAGGLKDSLNCFLTQIVDGRGNDAEGFIAAMHQYCGTGIWEDPNNPTPLCHNNPDFLSQLKSAYEGLGGRVNLLSGASSGQSFGTQAVAIVVIGSPPNDLCSLFNFAGNWTSAERSLIGGVCLAVSTSPQFVSLVRNAGVVILERVPDGSLGSGVCGSVNGGNTISIACTFGNQPFANYVVIHELGHVVGNRNGGVFNSYVAVYNQESLLPTYPFDCRPCRDEGFAEMIADNVVYKTYNYLPRPWSSYPGGPFTTYPSQFPAHYDFAKQQIFGGVEF